MTGSLIALAAKGAQDINLTYKPQMTYWKSCHKRYSNFAIERIQQEFQGQVRLGSKLVARMARNSDLASRTYLALTFDKVYDNRPRIAAPTGLPGPPPPDTLSAITSLGDNLRFTNGVGFVAIQELRFLVGGHEIERTNGIQMALYEDLCTPERRRYRELVGDFDSDDDAFAQQSLDPTVAYVAGETVTFYVPLFLYWSKWCRRDMSLPLIALQYHESRIEITLRPLTELLRFTYNADPNNYRDLSANSADPAAHHPALTAGLYQGGTLQDAVLIIDSVFLDTRERKAFSCKCLEYLITQTQLQDFSVAAGFTSLRLELNFNHPVMYLQAVWQSGAAQVFNDWLDFTGVPAIGDRRAKDAIATAAITFNGNLLDQPLGALWWRLVEPGDHGAYRPDYFQYVFPFALCICDCSTSCGPIDPSGSINFSRIDSVHLQLTADGVANANSTIVTGGGPGVAPTIGTVTGATPTMQVFAKNYNMAKVAAGMFGLYYAN